MKITYLDCDGEHKLFSFHRHDYNQWESTITKKSYVLDGGLDYIRCSENGTTKIVDIEEVIEDIREVFHWGRNFTKEGKTLEIPEKLLLKDISDSHCLGIISHLISRSVGNESQYCIDKGTMQTINFMLEELKYRKKKGIKVEDYD